MTVWFASGNAHKKEELASILAASGEYKVHIPADAGLDFDPDETGNDFCENALLKARALYDILSSRPSLFQNGDSIIADDSGLCVDALDGRPGLYSAVYTGKVITCLQDISPDAKKIHSSERNALLLAEMGDKPNRGARFVCSMVLLYNPSRFFLAQETMEGEIVKGPEFAKGTGGFGYDPVLFIPELGRTVAELSEDEKNIFSHRAKSGKIIATMLKNI